MDKKVLQARLMEKGTEQVLKGKKGERDIQEVGYHKVRKEKILGKGLEE